MNAEPYVIYSAVAAAVTCLLLGMLAAATFRERRRRGRDAALRTKYLHILMLSLTAPAPTPPLFPQLRRPGARLLLAEAVAGVVAVTYGLDPAPLRRVVARYGIDSWLMTRARRRRGYRRARYLALLSRLPVDGAVAEAAGRYVRSRNRYVRFYALAVRLAADPATALRQMGEYPYPFSAAEVAEIMALLRRGMLPVAYGPLMASPLSNLRKVGLCIVRQFGIEEAEAQLLRIVAEDEVEELGLEALYTLCSMRRPLGRGEVAARVARLTPAQRKALLRHMAFEGYTPGALRRLFDPADRPYYESLVRSYKRSLA
ncbi:hypothetical protein [Alistipes sp.]|uniref:hypothetical protein n=1 Tax=Alistipes sp. TaxID=1872444 RepID=UPI003AF0C253